MPLQNRLYNPTPFEVRWPYDKGREIVIEPDGYFDIEDAVMLQDFHEAQPGAEEVKEAMNHFGIFLRDPSRSFDAQALEAIEARLRRNRQMYNEAVANLRSKMAGANMSDPKVFEEHLRINGYSGLKDKIDALESRSKLYRSELAGTGDSSEEEYDPKRTLLFHSPPKVFETELAMKIYLSEHPEEAKKHAAFMEAHDAASC